MATTNTSWQEIFNWFTEIFSNVKCVDSLNAANNFNVHAYLRGFSISTHIYFVNKATGLRLQIPKRKVTLNVCSFWPIAQISDDFYYLGIWQCARYFVAALFK